MYQLDSTSSIPLYRLLGLTALVALGGACFEDVDTSTSASTSASTSDDDDDDDATSEPETDDEISTSEDDSSEADATDEATTDEATTDEGVPCGPGHSCAPDPGPAWTGPVAIATTEDGCHQAFPDELTTAFTQFGPTISSCMCNCGDPDVSCSTNMSAIGYGGLNCVNGLGADNINQNQCFNTFSTSHGVSLSNASSTCADGLVNVEISAPILEGSIAACGGFEPGIGECEAGADCVPDPGPGFMGGLCYWSPGDVACPAGYPLKTLMFTEVEDTRSCPDTCACDASQPTCSVSITGYANFNCSSPQGAVVASSGSQACAATNSDLVRSIRPGNVSVSNAGSCSPEDLAVEGELAANNQVSVCCSG